MLFITFHSIASLNSYKLLEKKKVEDNFRGYFLKSNFFTFVRMRNIINYRRNLFESDIDSKRYFIFKVEFCFAKYSLFVISFISMIDNMYSFRTFEYYLRYNFMIYIINNFFFFLNNFIRNLFQ